MKRAFKSDRHAALSDLYPADHIDASAMSGPHRRPQRSRALRYALVIAAAVGIALYRYLTRS